MFDALNITETSTPGLQFLPPIWRSPGLLKPLSVNASREHWRLSLQVPCHLVYWFGMSLWPS